MQSRLGIASYLARMAGSLTATCRSPLASMTPATLRTAAPWTFPVSGSSRRPCRTDANTGMVLMRRSLSLQRLEKAPVIGWFAFPR